MEPRYPTDEGTPFNMAMLYYMQIQKIMDKLTWALCDNDLALANELIEELLTKVSFKLNDKEKEELERKNRILKKKFSMYHKTGNAHFAQQIKEKIRELNRDLLQKMDKYNMIFPRIEVQGGIERLKKRYNLEP